MLIQIQESFVAMFIFACNCSRHDFFCALRNSILSKSDFLYKFSFFQPESTKV